MVDCSQGWWAGTTHITLIEKYCCPRRVLAQRPKTNPGVREIREYKHFDAELFVEDLSRMPWNAIQQFNNLNTCWNVWKSFFTDTLNRHAPIQHKRTRRNSVPWITPRIKALMRNRDYHKKRAIKYASQTHWESFKKLRNEVNIQMRNAKFIFFP